MTDSRRWTFRRTLGACFAACGLVLLVVYGTALFTTWDYQRQAKAEIQASIKDEVAGEAAPGDPASSESATSEHEAAAPLKPGEIIGRVDIPRIMLSAAIAEGDDEKTLGNAVGHLPDTPLPWQRAGNVGLAAHRDGLFRPLAKVRVNDDVRLVTSRGEYHYRVTKTHIVDPDEVWVLAPTVVPTMTMITCYPFSFVGNAPQRFIVHAELVQDVAGSALTGTVVQ
jgi:sortase A